MITVFLTTKWGSIARPLLKTVMHFSYQSQNCLQYLYYSHEKSVKQDIFL